MNKRTKKLLAMMAAPPRLRRVSGLPPLTYWAKKAGTLTDYRIYGQTSRNLSEVNEFSNSITDTSNKLQIWVQQGKDQSFVYPDRSNIFVITEPTTITTRITITNDNDSIRIKHNGYARDIVIDVVRGLSYGVYSVSFNVLDYDQTTVGGIVINNIMVNKGSAALPYEPYGESVGDRTGNLFDKNDLSNGSISAEDGTTIISNNQKHTATYIPVNGSQNYTLTARTTLRVHQYSLDYSYLGSTLELGTFITNANAAFIRLAGSKEIFTDTTITIMLNAGSTSLPYEPYGYRVPVTVSNGTDTLTTPIYLPEQIRKVGDEAEYIDYGEQKQHRVRKNLLQNAGASQTINGVTFTVNADGSVTCNGTASETVFYKIGVAPFGNCILNGCPQNGSANSYLLRIIEDITSVVRCTDFGGGATANITNTSRCEIRIYSNYTCNNLTFYPMIRKADITDDTYEPYITNTELDVTLPALPTVAGTNTLTVGTEVQPSLIEVTGRIRPVPTGGGE